jgi:FKBP-type peptidyl-prolyl cis-trans isomerase (trigger factor)
MQIQRIEENDGIVTYRVNATAEEVADGFDRGLQLFVDQLHIGNLPGATPREKIEGSLDAKLAKETIESAVMSYLIPFVFTQEKIIPIASADVKAETLLSPKLPFSFMLKVLPKPHYHLTDYEPFAVTVPAVPAVTDDDVEAQIRILAAQLERAKAIDEDRDPGAITIPAITDGWVAQNFASQGMSTVEDLRANFRHSAEHAVHDQYEGLRIQAIMDEYAKRLDGEITQSMVDLMVEDMVQGLSVELEGQGSSLEYYLAQQEMEEDELRQTFGEQARMQLLQGLVLDAIFEHEHLKVEVPDLMSLLHQMAPGAEEDTFNQMQESSRTFLLMEGAQRGKAMEWIDEHIKVIEAR